MHNNLLAFIIFPSEVVVYSYDNTENNNNYIYNAGSLEYIESPEITNYTNISGFITTDFNTDPIVLGYADGLFEVVYAPQNVNGVFTSDGSPAKHRSIPITARSTLKVPNIDKLDAGPNAEKLIQFDLDEPNMD